MVVQYGVQNPRMFVVDVWLVIMSYMSVLDLTRLGSTCRALHEFVTLPHVWRDALIQHRFLDQCYPHLRSCAAQVIRHQLITTARLDHIWTQPRIIPKRIYTFPLNSPGVFQGLKFLPGGTWLVFLFHCRNLNPSRHSNLCLIRPSAGFSEDDPPAASTTFQSDMCWLPFLDQDGPYKSSRGDDLMLLRTKCNDGSNAFGIAHLDTKTPSIRIPLTFRTNVFVRNYAAAGDYVVYGWITTDRKHLLRIMQLNENYDGFRRDVTVEIDCPKGHDGKLRIRYDLRLSSRIPRILLVSTRLIAAYNVPSDIPNDSDSNPRLLPFWQLHPAAVTFGRFITIFHEGAIVSSYEGQIRFIRPELDASEPNAHVIEKYTFKPSHLQCSQWPSLFAAQRIFWNLTMAGQKETADHCQIAIETTAVPENEYREGRTLMDFQEAQILDACPSARNRIVQDWDELSGRLCIRSSESRFPQDLRTRRTTWRVTLVDFV
ncbi:hypothetical protein K503DRAFT_860017 [Rhizopogon vinicolor AM-OR11-026]|uniref:F-box domain-containing protein n=1 Tax=Rhizopogon vinicolor AM-OR11-026 TaxID=1314800 RepID=A0A1B7MKA8_9AGAM|nr:hypothetical protein K503DRAFT_860017 [Rhizopogon vinicolor AM-OR11-026]